MSERPVVVGADEQVDREAPTIDVDKWVRLAGMVLREEGIEGPAELGVTFVDIDRITSLNEDHLGGSGPTDVLAFPIDEPRRDLAADDIDRAPGPLLLGDVIVCPKIVLAQAPGEADDEMALMIVHGVLHILGMDHAEAADRAEMRSAETRLLEMWRLELGVAR